jgi:putative DNA primase/helicase
MSNFILDEKGVWFVPTPTENVKEPESLWICSSLEVIAITRDDNNENFGRLLQFYDSDGNEHKWALPMEYLAAEGAEYRRILLSKGVLISTGKQERNHLTTYIQQANPKKKIRCVGKIGWFEGVYVFPDETIGTNQGEEVVYQSLGIPFNPYEKSGTLEEWKQNISRYCVDNSRLSFGVCIAFAAPILNIMDAEGGGFHLRGRSSGGKTTTLKIAASVFGGKKMIHTWRSTSNGMEAIAALHNDCLLCLDELGQIDPNEAGEAAYLLGNGSGKARANRMGAAKEKQTWTLLYLSTGEVGLSDHMKQSGKKARAGQEIRILDIPAETGAYGIFESLHDYNTGAEFSRLLSQNTQLYHGIAGRIFIEKVINNLPAAKNRIRVLMDQFVKKNLPPNADGQVIRALQRMGIIAAVGTYATELGITGWPEEEGFWGVEECFKAWIKGRGGVSAQEFRNILKQVRHFFELHGESRFSLGKEPILPNGMNDHSRTYNRAGFKKLIAGKMHYLVFPEVFRTDICAGLDPEISAKILMDTGILTPDSEGKNTRAERLPGFESTIRCYCFNEEKIFSDDI